MKKFIASAVVVVGLLGGLTACQTDAQKVSDNLSTDADQFKVQRRITFINGITDKYMLSIEGLCSFTRGSGQLTVICKVKDGTGTSSYVKDTLGLSDNVTYIVEQAKDDAVNVSKYHYKVVLKPESILPSFDVELGQDN